MVVMLVWVLFSIGRVFSLAEDAYERWHKMGGQYTVRARNHVPTNMHPAAGRPNARAVAHVWRRTPLPTVHFAAGQGRLA